MNLFKEENDPRLKASLDFKLRDVKDSKLAKLILVDKNKFYIRVIIINTYTKYSVPSIMNIRNNLSKCLAFNLNNINEVKKFIANYKLIIKSLKLEDPKIRSDSYEFSKYHANIEKAFLERYKATIDSKCIENIEEFLYRELDKEVSFFVSPHFQALETIKFRWFCTTGQYRIGL